MIPTILSLNSAILETTNFVTGIFTGTIGLLARHPFIFGALGLAGFYGWYQFKKYVGEEL